MKPKCPVFFYSTYDEIMACKQVGGSEEAYLAAKPLFLSMGKNTVYCGGAGNGSVNCHSCKYNFCTCLIYLTSFEWFILLLKIECFIWVMLGLTHCTKKMDIW